MIKLKWNKLSIIWELVLVVICKSVCVFPPFRCIKEKGHRDCKITAKKEP